MIVLIANISCKKIDGDNGTAQLPISLHYVDSFGNDLFSFGYDGKNGYWMDSIKVRNIKSGSNYYTLDCFSDHTIGYQFQQLDILEMKVCPNSNIENQYSYTIIQLKKGVVDTLKVHITNTTITPSTNADSIWYNNILLEYDSTATLKVIKS